MESPQLYNIYIQSGKEPLVFLFIYISLSLSLSPDIYYFILYRKENISSSTASLCVLVKGGGSLVRAPSIQRRFPSFRIDLFSFMKDLFDLCDVVVKIVQSSSIR